MLGDFFREIEEMGAKMPQVAKRLGRTIACHKGCSGCCHSLVLISAVEAEAIAVELNRDENAALRARFVAAATEWARALGTNASLAADALAEGDTQQYSERMRLHALAHTLCPLNEDGLCSVYGARPLPCRKLLAVDTHVYCVASTNPNQPKANVLSAQPWEDVFSMSKRVAAGLQAAMGRGIRRDPIPLAVLRALGELDESPR